MEELHVCIHELMGQKDEKEKKFSSSFYKRDFVNIFFFFLLIQSWHVRFFFVARPRFGGLFIGRRVCSSRIFKGVKSVGEKNTTLCLWKMHVIVEGREGKHGVKKEVDAIWSSLGGEGSAPRSPGSPRKVGSVVDACDVLFASFSFLYSCFYFSS